MLSAESANVDKVGKVGKIELIRSVLDPPEAKKAFFAEFPVFYPPFVPSPSGFHASILLLVSRFLLEHVHEKL